MGLITTAEQLAEAIVTDPERVAECLGRINRFGGQAVGCSVLQHSLGVYYRSLAQPLSVRRATHVREQLIDASAKTD